jgi:hypothetical protein
MSKVPVYPNAAQAIGSSMPVVTSLLAAVGTAMMVVPLATQSAGKCVRFASWDSNKWVVAFGSLAVTLFISATLALVYCHSLIGSSGELSGGSKSAYKLAQFFWINGISALALTLGCLTFNEIRWELPVSAVISLIAALLNVLAGGVHIVSRAVSCLVALASSYIVVLTSAPIHPFC